MVYLNEVDRITELYLKASVREDPMLEEWIMAATLRNLTKTNYKGFST